MVRSRTKLVAALAVLVILCAGYFGSRFVLIAWHRFEMGAAYRRIAWVESAHSDYERHRTALIKLGYFTRHQFYLKRITTRSLEFNELIKKVESQFPEKIGKIEGHGYIYGEPTFLVVWLHSSDENLIGDFIKQVDENQPAADAISR